MSRYLCHAEPDLFQFQARVVAHRPNAVLLDHSLFYPGGGGQLPDRGMLRWAGGAAKVTGIELQNGYAWHCIEGSSVPDASVTGEVDRDFRSMMSQLHTDLHILNALVYQRFEGSLVTGVQMANDGTARIDFDLPEADNSELRALEPYINSIIMEGLDVQEHYVNAQNMALEPGVIRSRSAAPPHQIDDMVRVIEIVGLDRQACGGTHLARTSQSAPVRILKIENKGQHNRRIRIGLVK